LWLCYVATGQLCSFYQSFVFAAFLVQLYELDGITGTGIAVAAKAAVRVGFGVNLEAGGFIRMERTF
jgi:hypothetical protein